MFSKIFFVISIFFLMTNILLSKENVFIVLNVDDQIITNYDLKKESDYLKVLNPNLAQLSNDEINKISKESLVNEIIKTNEIKKIFDLNKKNSFLNDYVKNLYTRLNFDNEEDFKSYLLNSSNYSFDEIKGKIKIELLWNELIYFKYSDRVNIDKEKFLNKVNNLNNETKKEYKLSEIIFKKEKNTNLDDLINKINLSISEIGFANTANLYSISESSKLGGKIGWIDRNNLSEKIYSKIINLSEGMITEIIMAGNDYMLIKVDEIRQVDIEINKEEELNKMIKFETNKQLNQFSKIYFGKAKMNYSVNEN